MNRNDRTLADFRAELATTFDIDVRAVFIRAIEAGPGTEQWSHALCVLGLRRAGRSTEPRPDWQRETWSRIDADVKRRQQRGRLVSIAARWGAAAFGLAIGALALFWLGFWLRGWL